jgi:23S rRNA pseudouridine1911/1915/1917 synthase
VAERLDRFLATQLPELSRSRIQALIADGLVHVNGLVARSSYKLAEGDEVSLTLPDAAASSLAPEAIALAIVYEDEDLLVIDKPAGMVVHPAPGHSGGTLVNAVLAHAPDLSGVGGETRPGIVHRLDKDTSGLIVVAKNDRAHRHLAGQLKDRRMDKRYVALVDGAPLSESGTIDAPIARDPRRPQQMAAIASGRPAVTHFRMLERYGKHTLLECKPVTGRTHQIRVHLASIGCPVAADRVYGRATPSLPLDRHFLHAARLTFRLPSDGERTFEAPLPADLTQALTRIG